MTQLNEAKEQVKPGVTKVTGTYGKEYDAGDDGTKKKPASDVKKGRGRPKKDADETGEVKKYDTSSLGNVFGGGKKPSKPIGKVSKKNTLKDWFEQLDKAIVNEGGLDDIRARMQQRGAGAPAVQRTNQAAMGRIGQMANRPVEEADQIEIKPASQVPQKPGQSSMGAKPGMSGQPQQVAGQPQNTQVIQQGDKTLGTVNNPALAQQIKQSIGKGEMTLMPDEEMAEAIDYSSGEFDDCEVCNGTGESHTGHGGCGECGGTGVKEPTGSDDDYDVDYDDNGDEIEPESHYEKHVRVNNFEGKDEGKPGKNFAKIAKDAGKRYGSKAAGERVAGAVRAKLAKQGKLEEADRPSHDSDEGANLGAGRNPNVLEGRAKADNKAEKAGKKVTKDLEYDMRHKGKDDAKAERAGKKVTKDIEYDEKKKVKEAKKPDANKNGIPDYAEDGKGKNDLKKKKVKEGMDHRLKAAHHAGKSHALSKQGYNCAYDDMEEARQYHDGYKQGLDECYGQMPIQGYVGETGVESTVDNMASFGAHTPALDESSKPAVQIINDYDEVVMEFDSLPPRLRAALQGSDFGAVQWLADLSKHDEDIDMSTIEKMVFANGHVIEVQQYIDDLDEGNAFTKKLATTPAGGSFSLGGKSFRDTSAYDSSVFESWDNELNSLLEEYDSITEGITVSSSQGQSNQPDSVSVTASDSDAQALMAVLRSAGIGGFGGGDAQGQTDDMTVDTGEPEEIGTGGAEIDVVDDHGNMMDLIRKVTGGAPKGPEQGFGGSHDEEGEEHEHGEEEVCDACGSADCECDEEGSDEEQQVDEVESEDQMEYEVAEDNAPDSGAAEVDAEDASVSAQNASAAAFDQSTEEDDLEESYANSADDTFESDIAYMTKIISGGLNKEKSTGQTTVPVVAGQGMRTGVSESRQLNESVVNDWKKLAGIK